MSRLFVCLVTRTYRKQIMKLHLCHTMWKINVWLLLLIFLRHSKKKTEYVCNCCHHLLFHKICWPFNITDYNINNNVVRKCLSFQYRMKIQRHKTSEENQQYMQHEWPHTTQRSMESQEVTYMEEFICRLCKNSLQRKSPKMPDQACANCLKLDDIPQDWDHLFTLERHLISFQLPFITIICNEKVWRTFQNKWPSCECSCNTGSNNQHTAMYAQPTTTIPC